METSEKLVLVGLGFLTGAILIAIGLFSHLFPEDRIKRNKMLAIAGIVLGAALISVGLLI